MNAHRTNLMAGITMIAPVLIKTEFYQFKFAEQRIKSPKRTGSSAKWSTGDYRPDNEKDKDKYLE
jgi:hypothetical protein